MVKRRKRRAPEVQRGWVLEVGIYLVFGVWDLVFRAQACAEEEEENKAEDHWDSRSSSLQVFAAFAPAWAMF
jgi:hypothetical protein